MVKRIIVSGLSSFTTTETVRSYFETFGELYECVLPPPPRYKIMDYGHDAEGIEERTAIGFEPASNSEVLDDEMDVEPFNEKEHGNFEKYMRKIGEGDAFMKKPRKTCAGYAFITYVDKNGFARCMENEDHIVDGVKCQVELASEEDPLTTSNIQSKRVFVSFFPLDRLTVAELKTTFGIYGKITDVEFVSDSEGPLHFCLITFSTPEAVDECIKKSHYVRGCMLFVRRAILREAVKIAEQNLKDDATRLDYERTHGYAGYTPHTPHARVNTTDVISQANFQNSYGYDPSAAAGYAPVGAPRPFRFPSVEKEDSPGTSDLLAGYGYGPRKW